MSTCCGWGLFAGHCSLWTINKYIWHVQEVFECRNQGKNWVYPEVYFLTPVKCLQSCSVSWVSIKSWRSRQDRQAPGSWEAFLSVKWNPAAQTVRAIACQVHCNTQLSVIWLAHCVVTDTVSELQRDCHYCSSLVNGEGNGFWMEFSWWGQCETENPSANGCVYIFQSQQIALDGIWITNTKLF